MTERREARAASGASERKSDMVTNVNKTTVMVFVRDATRTRWGWAGSVDVEVLLSFAVQGLLQGYWPSDITGLLGVLN